MLLAAPAVDPVKLLNKMETGNMLTLYFFAWVALLFGMMYVNAWLPLVFLLAHFAYGVSQRMIGMKEE